MKKEITMKKALCLVLALVLLMLAACGAKETPPESSSAPTPSSSSAPESSLPALPDGLDPAVAAAVADAVARYRSGATPENATPLPEGFLFPEALDWNIIQVEEAENGGCEVLVYSDATESPREGLFINGPERAVFQWDGSKLATVWFQLDRSEQVVPIAVDSDEQVEAAVEELIAQYKAGTAEVTENIPALPEGFAFPDQLNWLELEIAFNDVTGAFQATVPSADGKQSAVFVCYKFAQEDGSTKCGVNTVIFH